MSKLYATLNKKNRGFTLVELIIVIAIILVLAAVLAPQYTRYVERSRQSNDLQIATSIMDATLAAVADPNNEVPSNATIRVGWRTRDGHQNIEVYFSPYSLSTSLMHSNGMTVRDNLQDEIRAVVAFNGGQQDAESEVGNSQDFIFQLDVDTGKIEVADTNPSPAANGWNAGSGLWVDEIGVNAPKSSSFNFLY